MRSTPRTWFLACALASALSVAAGCGATSGEPPPSDPGSSVASLASLDLSTGSLTPDFDPGTTTYGVGPVSLDGTVTVTAVALEGGTLTVNGVPTPSGSPSAPIPLPFGVSPITVEVTSANGAVTTTYTIVFDRAVVTAQEAYVKASNTGAGDRFGYSIAISGDTLVVGAPLESSSATGVNPGPAGEADDGAQYSGAAYVFVRSGSTWTQQAYLKASNTDAEDVFGLTVAIDGDTLVVGAYGEDSDAAGVNPGPAAEANDGLDSAGAAYVYVRTGTTWTQQAYLKSSNPGDEDRFGSSVAVDGDTIAVSASFEDSSATGVNGGPDAEGDDTSQNSGAVYVFVRSGATWTQQAYVKASNTGPGDAFGVSVSVSGDTLVVGAHAEDSSATGVNPGPGGEADEGAPFAGAAYVFVRSGTTWSQQAYLKASNAGGVDYFGICVRVSGDTIAVGAIGEGSNATGVNAGPAAEALNVLDSAGAVYVFVRSGTTWTQQAYVKASNTGDVDWFGYSLDLDGDVLVVGAPNERSTATGVNPGAAAQANDDGATTGAGYVFTRTGTTWTQRAYVKASDTADNDQFGWGTGVSGTTVGFAAENEKSAATGVNPGPAAEADVSAIGAGAVYLFR